MKLNVYLMACLGGGVRASRCCLMWDVCLSCLFSSGADVSQGFARTLVCITNREALQNLNYCPRPRMECERRLAVPSVCLSVASALLFYPLPTVQWKFDPMRFESAVWIHCKVWGSEPGCGRGCPPPGKTSLPRYHAEFGPCRWNGPSVIKEISLKNLTPRVLPFKVTQGHRKRRKSIGCLWPVNDP